MRRSSSSVPTNIVEGFARNGYKDALNFYNKSEASLEELKYQTLLSLDLGYFDNKTYRDLINLENTIGSLLKKWQKKYKAKK